MGYPKGRDRRTFSGGLRLRIAGEGPPHPAGDRGALPSGVFPAKIGTPHPLSRAGSPCEAKTDDQLNAHRVRRSGFVQQRSIHHCAALNGGYYL